MEKICVLGLGYIGLPTASILATNGFHVLGVDIQKTKISQVRRALAPIEEPGLKTLLEAALNSGHLSVSSKPRPADVFIICVPTPLNKNSKSADLSYVVAAAQSIVPHLRRGNCVILESTVPPGTTEKILLPILKRCGLAVPGQLCVAHCPERVLPGNILKELVSNDRVIGGMDKTSALMAGKIYEKFTNGKMFLTDTTTAEIVKLAENTYRDVNIAFANELDAICSNLGVNTWEVIKMANRHPRVRILNPGPGVGGHCIAVDPWFLAEAAPTLSRLIQTSRSINDERPARVIEQIMQTLKTIHKSRPTVACLGLTYKANVDDLRESPALEIVLHLQREKTINVLAVDPHINSFNGTLRLMPLNTALRRADLIALLVDHKEFLDIDWQHWQKTKKHCRILDFKGALPSDSPITNLINEKTAA